METEITTKPTAPLTAESFAFWADYTQTSDAEIAKLAGISVDKVSLILAMSEISPEEFNQLEPALIIAGRELANGRESRDAEVAAKVGLSVEKLRLMVLVLRNTTEADYAAILAVIRHLIDTKARAKMLAYAAAHPTG